MLIDTAIKILRNLFVIYMMLLLSSCIKDSYRSNVIPEPETRGVMQLEITENAGAAEDRMETVRFMVFKNVPDMPELELNELFDIPPVDAGDDEVSKFKITLEVSRKMSGLSSKMVVAIVNEPSNMKIALDAVETYDQLRKIELDLADFLNASHSGLQNGKTMPMTGVVWTDKVYGTPAEAEGNLVALPVQRAVARVDVHISKARGQDYDMALGTAVTLKRSYDKEFLVRYDNGSNVFGQIKTLTDSDFIDKSWNFSSSDSKEIPVFSNSDPGRLVCSFYTAERTCHAAGNTDKLLLDMLVVTSEGAIRTGHVVFDVFNLEGTETDVSQITRNNSYKVVSTIGEEGITGLVLDWNEYDIIAEL